MRGWLRHMRYAVIGAAGALRDPGSWSTGDLDDRAALDRLCAGAAGHRSGAA